MRFALTGGDRTLGVFEALVQAGWQPVKLFSTPPANQVESNSAIVAYAQQHDAAIQLSRMTERDIADLGERGCEVLIVASYSWRIGNWQPYLKYAVNLHPSPLPLGRGPYPLPRAIQEQRDTWGVTCHRLAFEMDAGDILAVEEFPLQDDECHESLHLKVQMASRRLAVRLAGRFPELWDGARPQGQGSYWPLNTPGDHCFDFNLPVESIKRHIRAFGATESLTRIGGAWIAVRRAAGWPERHGQAPGTVLHAYGRYLVVAALDGCVALLDWEAVRPDLAKMLSGL